MMRCTICNHPARTEIEAALAQGVSLRNIARQNGTSYSAIDRHAKKCLGQALVKVQDEREQISGLNILNELESVNQECKGVLAKAKKNDDSRLVLQALDRICKQLELQARFLEVLQKQDPNLAEQIRQKEMKERQKEYEELFELYLKEQEAHEIRTIVFYPPYPPSECQECETYRLKVKPYEREGRADEAEPYTRPWEAQADDSNAKIV